MLSVQDAAKRLGVSGARIRAMLKTGQLDGDKVGSTWVVSETSVAARIANGSRPGRPASVQEDAFERPLPDVEAAHRVYDEAARVLAGCYTSAFLDQARTPEEQAFWIRTADFFLQQKQRELVKKGVF